MRAVALSTRSHKSQASAHLVQSRKSSVRTVESLSSRLGTDRTLSPFFFSSLYFVNCRLFPINTIQSQGKLQKRTEDTQFVSFSWIPNRLFLFLSSSFLVFCLFSCHLLSFVLSYFLIFTFSLKPSFLTSHLLLKFLSF